ncbi:uncharacterized protein LOC129728370 [Wyeomyia smithii]|uniref:uncharacterized protein LOC129728370 n=1 Tax=Wyeomyia smithii TaxID=174621 RepID=UPI002467E74E|nr:uncharacterized protein LOC129728370 [Wyeomyia smithii]
MCRTSRNLRWHVIATKRRHRKKLLALSQTQAPRKAKRSPQHIDNFVVNLSSTQLTQPELELLNKGLNFAVSPSCPPVADTVNNIESAIQYNSFASKSAIRHDVERCMSNVTRAQKDDKQLSFDAWCTIRQLKARDVVYSRADKGNAVVIMDKQDYDARVLDMIAAGPYEEYKFKNGKPKDPLNTMTEEANTVRQKVARLMGEDKLERKFHVPNPKVASLYCLPKIHKSPLAMRPISSNICIPTEKMAAWVVDEMKNYPVTHGMSVKNSVELVDYLKDVEIRRGEALVSFDVTALFPSVPVTDALNSLRRHLERKKAPPNHIEAYLLITETCMNQNFFSFRGRFYRQVFGLSMGNKLSPLLADLFMSDFEVALSTEKYFPRVWKRYVDDIFAVVKERYLIQTLELLNSRHRTIKFTVEKETDGSLPFLDLRIKRNGDNTLKFSIYRKPTATDRYITSDSNHYGAQKQAAFHSMAHRLYNIPMDRKDFETERNRIHKAAELNGYDKDFVNKILRKHQRKKHRLNCTTLKPEKEKQHRISLPFYPKITNPVQSVLQKHDFYAVYKSENTLKDLLCNSKDKVPPDEKSGVYQIPCKNCSAVYIGQTRRKLKVRLREHKNAVDNDRANESSVAAHTISQNHAIDWENAKLLKNVRKTSNLNAWESMYITTADNPLMNEDDPPILSSLFHLTKL